MSRLVQSLLLIALCLCSVAARAGDTAAADAAYRKGDYRVAARDLRVLAEKGEAKAQYRLGVLYDSGKGVKRDRAKAAHWYTKAAQQGFIPAQYNLAILYYNGQGVERDLVLAYAWLQVTIARGYRQAETARDAVATEMSPRQIKEAKEMARKILDTQPG